VHHGDVRSLPEATLPEAAGGLLRELEQAFADGPVPADGTLEAEHDPLVGEHPEPPPASGSTTTARRDPVPTSTTAVRMEPTLRRARVRSVTSRGTEGDALRSGRCRGPGLLGHGVRGVWVEGGRLQRGACRDEQPRQSGRQSGHEHEPDGQDRERAGHDRPCERAGLQDDPDQQREPAGRTDDGRADPLARRASEVPSATAPRARTGKTTRKGSASAPVGRPVVLVKARRSRRAARRPPGPAPPSRRPAGGPRRGSTCPGRAGLIQWMRWSCQAYSPSSTRRPPTAVARRRPRPRGRRPRRSVS
jgi:hypothetical protein